MLILTVLYPAMYIELFEPSHHSNILRLIMLLVNSILFTSSIILLIGICKEYQSTILIWLILMLLSWNANLFLHLTYLTIFVTEKQRRMSETFLKCILLIMVQGVWLALVSIVWRYWRTLVVIRDVPEYIEFLTMRREAATRSEIIAEDF
ncbi:hypothetical protein ILUMI_01168 [Ignelater luminosus]|uniref:Uncharacterized protein n=1 Tax=Ignelater luminosus TaxID=2038154 RepID=A0A8K0DEU6_IGNLU|nr:hypothetical protein ILUMI_01168 [Ignelater luminosus]